MVREEHPNLSEIREVAEWLHGALYTDEVGIPREGLDEFTVEVLARAIRLLGEAEDALYTGLSGREPDARLARDRTDEALREIERSIDAVPGLPLDELARARADAQRRLAGLRW